MIRVLLAVLLAAQGSTVLTAQTAAPAKGGAELLRLEDQFTTALVTRDEAAFRRLSADGFIYTENDQTTDRDALIRGLVEGSDRVEAARNEDMQVHRFGSTAVVTGWMSVRGLGAEGAFDRRYRFTDTWVRRHGTWQIVAAHDYLVPDARSKSAP